VVEATDEAEVVVIGSGFGGSVATLRFAEAGHQVVVLERGDRVSRDKFQADLDFLWKPARNAFGFHDIRPRGKQVIPWIGAAVGGGSHCYAGTLKRRDTFDEFPSAIQGTDMTAFYDRAEEMIGSSPLPDYPPYGEIRATQLMLRAGARLEAEDPEHLLVEGHGRVHLGISFAPPGGEPGAEFVNQHGCRQRYYDPTEQSILGGDIDTKNSLDRNYLYVAEHEAKRPAEIRPLCEADRIEVLADGRYRVHYVQHVPATGWAAFRQRYLFGKPPARPTRTITARRLVIAAGAIGSSELLLRNRDLHKTLPLGRNVGERYTTNGDYLTLIVRFRGLFVSWAGFVAMVVCLILGQWIGLAIGAAAYYGGLLASRSAEPDVGTTNSDHIQFKNHRGVSQGAYIESGRYPTPGGILAAFLLSGLTGRFGPRRYRGLLAASRALRWIVPPFGALARTYPIPLLSMGKDDAYGRISLDRDGEATIDYDVDANKRFYAHLAMLGRKVAKAADAYWLPDLIHKVLGRLEVPHNQGGVPMADSPDHGVVDHAGRVFGMPNLMVLDGSIIPVSVGPNPALTIAAVAERAMEIVVAQLDREGTIVADLPAAVEIAS
jgi:cholesterol oxidase